MSRFSSEDISLPLIGESQSVFVDWQNVEFIFFDMDGTLLDLHFDNYFWMELVPQAYAHKKGSTDLRSIKMQLQQMLMSKKGELNWYCLDFWSRELDLDVAALKKNISTKIKPLPYALEFLDFLTAEQLSVDSLEMPVDEAKKSVVNTCDALYSVERNTSKKTPVPKCELWLTTNAHRASIELKLSCSQIGGYFKHIISSHDFGYAKEHPRFWQQLQKTYAFDPQKVLFIDDSPEVLATAREYGIAQQLMILQPDSQMDANQNTEFKSIVNFKTLLDEWA